MHVRAAYAHGVQLDAYIARAEPFFFAVDCREIPQRQFVFLFQDERLHPFSLS
jgi:hypothetical protein